jgi:zinc-ribbon domain
LRCGRCGNENDDTNRFCGMCGAALVAAKQAGGQVGGVSAERPAAAVSGSEARSDAWPNTRPVISGGPSLLGLNLPPSDAGSERGDRGRDALRLSSNLDYLLEDEEESRSGWGKWLLVVVALALAAGFGYLHWKSGGFDWLNAGDKKPAVTAQTPDSGQSGTDSGAAAGGAAPQAGASGAGSGLPAGSAAAGAANAGESGAPQTTSSQNSSSQNSGQGTPSQGAPAQSAPTQSTASQNTTPQSTASQSVASQSSDQQSTPQSDAGDARAPGSGSQAGSSDSDTQSPSAEATPRAVVRKPAAARPALAKPAAAKPAAAKPVDSVTEAERYIYGRGSAQDCDHGLRLLTPAAEQSNVKAMISLGALYSTGTCTPRDLPTAYRWFALALHKEPDNQVLQTDLQNLWSKMTPPERQLAIKLSQ